MAIPPSCCALAILIPIPVILILDETMQLFSTIRISVLDLIWNMHYVFAGFPANT
jgi:hypothetical protein